MSDYTPEDLERLAMTLAAKHNINVSEILRAAKKWKGNLKASGELIDHCRRIHGPEMDRLGATCAWKQDDIDDLWETSCGQAWTFIDGGPGDNHVLFCHSCGRRVVAIAAGDGK